MLIEKNNIIIIGIYMSFIIALLLNFIPIFSIQTIGGILFIFTFLLTYILKYSAKKQSFERTHYTYITKTLWIFSLFLTLGIITAALMADNTIINEFMANIQYGIILTEEQMTQKLIQYSLDNLMLFLFVFVPISLYFLYRLVKGLHFLLKGLTQPNPNSWF